ncbi:MAG: histidine kinase [Ferruginibacter sp.]
MLYRYLLFILTFCAQTTIAQSRYNFFTIGTEQGLSNPNIWSINQDKYGFIWLATVNGLNRYDGHSMKQYFHKANDPQSIAGNTIFWIFKDSDGEMWFACGADGLSKYNYAKDNFESLSAYDSARKNNRYNSPVWRFGEDASKRIYLSCGAACYRYDKRTKKFDDLTPLFGKDWDHGIGRFFMQNEHTMWLPTDNGLFRFDVAANKMRKLPFDTQKMGFGSSAMYDAELINDHELLIPMERAGYVIFNINTETFRPASDEFNPAKTGRFTEMGAILKDSRGRFWMANSTVGLNEYFPADDHAESVKKELLYPYPYPEQEGKGKAVFEDKNGNIWYGTSTQGAIRFQPDFDFIRLYKRDYSMANSLPDDNVTSFSTNTSTPGTWIGTFKGIAKFSPATNTYNRYPYAPDLETDFPGMYIRAMDSAGDTLFIGTHLGLSIYNQRTNIFKRYLNKTDSLSPNDFSIFNNNIRFLFHSMPGELILVNGQAGRFNMATGKCYYKQNTPGDPLYDLTKIEAATFDKQRHTLWLEANGGELYSYNLVSKILTPHLYNLKKDSNSAFVCYSLNTDAGGTLWMGTNKGIIHYNSSDNTNEWFSSVSGNVINIASIDKDRIWYSTRTEIGRLDRQTKKMETFSINAVLPNAAFIARSMKADNDGNFWIGTDQGYCIFDPSKFKSNASGYFPRLVSFKVFDEEKHFDVPNGELKRIDLRYGENFFSFNFSAFDFQKTTSPVYSYKLENFDKDWNNTTENSASYTNVKPGTYTLLIRSANSLGGWDEMQQPITIHIESPFWQQPWFIALCIAALIGLAASLYFSHIKALKKKNIEKTIDYFANSVYGENSVTEICWDIARNCISQLQFEDCVVYLLNEQKDKLVQVAAYGPKNPKGHEIENPLDIEIGKGIVGTVAVQGKPMLVSDTRKDSRYIVDDEMRLSELAVPILHNGEVIGVIDSEHKHKHFFTEAQLKAVTTIASISANKIAEAKAGEQAKKNAIKVLEINKMLAESQLMALRAQMNPHFVFNCLNSIQECIVTEKYGEASKYLNKFSKLFRMVLNNSGKNLVNLNEEKDVLTLYLELEQMRFEKSFSFNILMDEELDADEILIPSMLVQPYVENALWHGLMHKDGKRELLIEFKRISEEVFECVIEDNGIGRKRSFELKASQSKSKRHESKGLKISKDRLDVLQQQGFHSTLQIIDKVDEAQNATGTKVIIELSTELLN